MRIALIADAYPPLRTSCAVQMRDLARAMAAAGHEITVLIPSADQSESWRSDTDGQVEVVRLRAPRTKGVSYARRTLAEMATPFAMMRNLRLSPVEDRHFDGVAWYSPSIFFAPLVRHLQRRNGCRSYLILRDVFPDWAADLGLLRRGLAFRVLRAIARYQYRTADVIGAQSRANIPLVQASAGPDSRIEVLENWMTPPEDRGCTIDLTASPIYGRTLLVYAGNMGVAQGMGRLLDLATALRFRRDLGFVFVGWGSDAAALRAEAVARKLDNVAFFDGIDPDEIPGLYAQCHVGLVALDPRHTTHNIPGKFVSYMHCGLPVLAIVNPGNDLIDLIRSESVGCGTTSSDIDELASLASIVCEGARAPSMRERCRALASRHFSAETAGIQVIRALAPSNG